MGSFSHDILQDSWPPLPYIQIEYNLNKGLRARTLNVDWEIMKFKLTEYSEYNNTKKQLTMYIGA